YQAIDIDDGNLRQAYQAYFSQQFFQSPQHTSTATVTGYYGRNKAVQVDYFNPVSSHSIELNLQHDWLTWREYERDFKQHFELTLGTFKQKDFAHQPVYNFLYRHDWRISRVWYLNYGVGWGSHPY
ncbi:poly-beta-1,6 N-acetyl-D-glucosamine export porin PgaA, partial [Klebsiella pneumoniae]|nr:poly-beta-1,6 N-acetyl-D-glucosamine export porin PgaA [Klebsiella pneumoniae]